MKVLITGGTGSVGRALIEMLHVQKGIQIDFTYYNNQSLAKELEKKYFATPIKLDDVQSINLDYDVIINNAAVVNSLVRCEDVQIENWEETLRVNITLPFKIIKKVLPHMRKKKWGRIINISSIYGVRAEEDVTPYAVSKHALIGLTRSVAKEYAQYKITCNAICPGTIDSDLSMRLAKHYTSTKKERKEYFDELKKSVPAGRLCSPIEVADLVKYLISENAAYINGATLMLDGGYTV